MQTDSRTADASPGSAPPGGSTYVDLIKSQAYMIQHQQDLLNNCIKRNADLVKVCNQVERENQTLRKKLKGHEDGKLWTLLWAMLPTRDMIEPK